MNRLMLHTELKGNSMFAERTIRHEAVAQVSVQVNERTVKKLKKTILEKTDDVTELVNLADLRQAEDILS